MAYLILKEKFFSFIHEKEGIESTVFENTRRAIDKVAFSWIAPVFFIVFGTRLVLNKEILLSVVEETGVLTVSLLFAQMISAGLAARYTGKYSGQKAGW